MIIKPISYKDTIIELRKVLIKHSHVKDFKILNALSVRGTDLSSMLSGTETDGYSMSDVFILFELFKNSDGNNYVTSINDDEMMSINSYRFHIIIYGNNSDTCLQYIKAAFKQTSVAQNLRNKGILITGIDAGESIHEFYNNTLWLRHDLNVMLETTTNMTNVEKQEYFDYNNSKNESKVIVETTK